MPDPNLATPGAPGGTPAVPAMRTRRGQPYQPAIGPRLRVLLFYIFACFAVLGATGVYLVAVHLLEWVRHQVYENPFSIWILIVHIAVGLLLLPVFFLFAGIHLATARRRPNRRAVRLGIGVFLAGLVVSLTGLALIQLIDRFQLPADSTARLVVKVLHWLSPLAALVLYILHRQAGPDIKWRWGKVWGLAVGAFLAILGVLHAQDPRQWYHAGSSEGMQYFQPSRALTADGKFIPAEALMTDQYCMKCHQDIYKGWFHSAHHFSSFNNPAYLFSVRETRKVSTARDGTPRASRWCAGCHDPVPFFSGKFDDPHYDDVNDPTSQAGITCVSCHAMTHINSTVGNADYTIEEPQQYPFALSDNSFLQWVNNQLVKAKPDLHKKTFLKDFHRTPEFCSVCHKVSIPMEVTDYKEFLRGQNHHDSYLLSGVSGHGARSFYYPPSAKTSCNDCHMPLQPSLDRGSKDFDGSGERKIHDHFFPGGNTGLPRLLSLKPEHVDKYDGLQEAIRKEADFLRSMDGKAPNVRIDLFGLKETGSIHGTLHAPLRPELPVVEAGKSYLVEVVVRTVGMGHPLTQGTVDSNELWVEFEARSGKHVWRNGGMSGPDDTGMVDEWAHRINVLMLDRDGNRVNRRNPQDIFTPLYNHQIPPGAGQVVHYKLDLPAEGLTEPLQLKVRLRYRKFDFEYMSLVHGGDDKVPKLPVVDLCADALTLPVKGGSAVVPEQKSKIQPAWQRWNDYGIGLYREGKVGGELEYAEQAFRHLLQEDKAAHAHAYLNLARVYFDRSELAQAADVLNQARNTDPPAPRWTTAWLTGEVNLRNGHLDDAIANFEEVLDPRNQVPERKFDFALDYEVINELGVALLLRSDQEKDDPARRDDFLHQAVRRFERTLEIDSENITAHRYLSECYRKLAGSHGLPAPHEVNLETLLAVLADPSQARPQRLEAADALVAGILFLKQQPAQRNVHKLPRLQALLVPCRTVVRDGDADLQNAAASVLAQAHGVMHETYLPNTKDEGQAVEKYSRNHPAAALAAKAVTIYPVFQVDK